MKYGDLPKLRVCDKLVNISFNTPQKNLNVFRFYNAVLPMLQFLEAERDKIIMKYGVCDSRNLYTIKNMVAYKDELTALMEMEIKDNIPILSLTEEDFDDQNCCYPSNKSMWMNGAEISAIIKFCEKMSASNIDRA